MQYPGHIVKAGETDAAIVKAVKARLNRALGRRNRMVRSAGCLDHWQRAVAATL